MMVYDQHPTPSQSRYLVIDKQNQHEPRERNSVPPSPLAPLFDPTPEHNTKPTYAV